MLSGRRHKGNGSEEAESKRGAKRTSEGVTMAVDEAGILFKNRAMERAGWGVAIAKPSLEPEPMPEIAAGPTKARRPKRASKPIKLHRINHLI
jgi:hypothetical protein